MAEHKKPYRIASLGLDAAMQIIATLSRIAPGLPCLGLAVLIGLAAWQENRLDSIGVAFAICALTGLGICFFRPSSEPRRQSLAKRRITARHEAGHALSALVLGLPLQRARIHSRAATSDLLGFIEMGPLMQPPTDPDPFWSLLIRNIAMLLAGVIAEQPWPDASAALPRLKTQIDWLRAGELSWIGSWAMSGSTTLSRVLGDVIEAFRTPAWQAAIDEAATLMLRAPDRDITADRFRSIVEDNNLELSAVVSLARNMPAPATGVEKIEDAGLEASDRSA